MKSVLKNILLVLNIAFAALIIISYLAIFISPDKLWIPALFGLGYPLLLLMNLAFVLLWLLLKPKNITFSLLAILVGVGFSGRYVQFQDQTIDNPDLNVMSFNVKHFSGTKAVPSKDLADSIISLLEKNKPEIICFQEVRLGSKKIFDLQKLVNNLKFINHYQYARTSSYGGSVTMTTYPIINMKEIRFENSKNLAIATDVLIDKDTVRIFNVHLQSFRIDPSKYSIIDSKKLTEEEDIKEVKDLGLKFKTAIKLRAKQARIIKEEINKSPYHVIVCGDFNDTPFSYTYQKVRGNLKDAFIESGKGTGRTYIGKLPSYRIDYILHSEGFESFNFKANDINLSDHRPIQCGLIKK